MKLTSVCDNLNCTKTTIFQQQMKAVHCPKCNTGNYCCQSCFKEDKEHQCQNSNNLNLDCTMQVDSSVNETLLIIQQQKRTLKDYEFVQGNKGILGNGAFGEVRLAIDIELEQEMAIKILNKKKMLRNCNIKQLEKEIKLQRKLNHPNIIQFYHAFEDNDNIYLVLEYAPCGSLYSYLRKKKKLSENEAFVYFFQSCLAIDYLHKKGVVHRDLKPENILLDSQGNVKVCDFGWSAESIDARNTFCGTYDYMAPEMLHNKPHDYRVDIWALGILLYELLHGSAPFTRQHFQKENISTLKINFSNSISDEAQNLISLILKPDVNQRLSLSKIFTHQWMTNYAEEFGQNIQEYIYVPSQQQAQTSARQSQASARQSQFSQQQLSTSKQQNETIKEESCEDSKDQIQRISIKKPDFLNQSQGNQKKIQSQSSQQKSEYQNQSKTQNLSRDSSQSSESESSQMISRSFQKQKATSNDLLGIYENSFNGQSKEKVDSKYKFVSQDLQLSLNSFSNTNYNNDQQKPVILLDEKNLQSAQFYGNTKSELKPSSQSPKASVQSQKNSQTQNFENSPYFNNNIEQKLEDQILDEDDQQKEKFSFGSQNNNSFHKDNSFEFISKEEHQINQKKQQIQTKETRLSKLSVIQSEDSESKSEKEDQIDNQFENKQRSSSANASLEAYKQSILQQSQQQQKETQDLYLVSSKQQQYQQYQQIQLKEQKTKNQINSAQQQKKNQVTKVQNQKINGKPPQSKRFQADYRNFNMKEIDKEDRNRFQDYKDSTKQLEIRSRELQAYIYSQDDKFSQRKSIKKTNSNQSLSFIEKIQLAFGCLGNR